MSIWNVVSTGEAQRRVDRYFAARVTTWTDIYSVEGLVPFIHQQRRALALQWIDELALAAGQRLLEVGCGAGLTAVALAERGFAVDAVDALTDMTERTRAAAATAGVGQRVTTGLEDAHHLTFADGTFQLTLAMGVLPWLHSPPQALKELARVVKPGGHVLVSAHNRWRLIDVLDPWTSPPLDPIKGAVGALLRRMGLRQPPPYLEPVARLVSRAELDRWLAAAGLRRVKSTTLGFGPFTFFGRALFGDRTGIKLHSVLQRWADRNVALVGSIGSQHMVLARKLPPVPPARR